MSRLHLHRLNALLYGVVIAGLLAGCGEEPRPPRLVSFTPAELAVPANDTLAISVEYEENDFALDDFQWRADAGAIEGNGAPSITYHAPGQPGDYRITVTTHYGDHATELSLAAVVKVTEPRATEPPVAATAPEAEAVAAASQAPEQQSGPRERPRPLPRPEQKRQRRALPEQRERRARRLPRRRPNSRSPTPAPATATAASPDQAIDRPGQTPQEQAAPAASAAVAGQEAAQPPAAPETSAPAEAGKEPPAEARPRPTRRSPRSPRRAPPQRPAPASTASGRDAA